MGASPAEYISIHGREGRRIHKATCKRLNHGLVPADAHVSAETAAEQLGNGTAKAASCCKPRITPAAPAAVKPEHVIDATPVQRTSDTTPVGYMPASEEHAMHRRASAQLKAERKWRDGGEKGKRPETPDLDHMRAVKAQVNGTAAPAAPAATEPAPAGVQANGRRRITDPAEQRTVIETLLGSGVKPGAIYKALRKENIAASSAWVAPLVAELAQAS